MTRVNATFMWLGCLPAAATMLWCLPAEAETVEAVGVQDVFTRQSVSNGNNNYGTDSFLRFRQRSGTTAGLSGSSTEMSWIQYDLGASVGSITDAVMSFTLDDGEGGNGVSLSSGGDSFLVYLLKETHPEETTWDANTVTGLGNAPDVLPPAKTAVDGDGDPFGLDFTFLDEVATFSLNSTDHDPGPGNYVTFDITLTSAGIDLLNAKTHGIATFVIASATDYDATNTLRVRSFDNTLLGSDPEDPEAGIPIEYFPHLVLEVTSSSLTGDLNGDGFVGQDDLNIVLGAWGTNVTPGDPLAGDPSGDGFVGQDDLNDVLAGWGQGTPPSGLVPEPASAALVMLGGLALLRRRRS